MSVVTLSGPPAPFASSTSAWHASVGTGCGPQDLFDALVGDDATTGRPSRAAGDRPAASATALTSTSGSSPPDSARVTTLRHGCCRASSGGQQAGAHLFLDPRVVVGHALQLVVAEQVDARVADVRQHRLAVVLQQHRRRRGRHAAQVDGRRHFVGEAPVGEVEGALEAAAVDRRASDRPDAARCSAESSLAVSPMNASIASTAIFEATSPATWPPMPSATMNRPRSGREQ